MLIPLFGVHYMVFVGIPEDVGEHAQLVRFYFEMFFNSFQVYIVNDIIDSIDSSYAEATFVQSTRMQKFLKNI